MDPTSRFDSGPLFEAVQLQGVFADGKTFVDCIPRRAPAAIQADYLKARERAGITFNLREFVELNFIVPLPAATEVCAGQPVERHIHSLWRQLRREPKSPEAGSSLLPLVHPYIVPGGRFREIYYWDSYFTMLGLRESGEEELIQNMADNFAWLIGRYGFVPNGNRNYYLSRSQPPCFSLIVELLAEKQGDQSLSRYLSALEAERNYWMDKTAPTSHLVVLGDGSILNRYYDQLEIARPESFAEDESIAAVSKQPRNILMRHIRSAAESGWDFSSRWFQDGEDISTIRTTELVPVDLNCFLYHLEATLARGHDRGGGAAGAVQFRKAAEERRLAILRHSWAEEFGFFCDYDIVKEKPTEHLSLAGVTPLFFAIATDQQAARVAEIIEKKFLAAGGLITTLRTTGQQWDAPNGWAPLQWITIKGLENYGYAKLAEEIARRWIKLNCDVYERTGKLMEKYNVVNVELEAGGGEYPSQDGFGWTNGVLLKLMRQYPAAAGRSDHRALLASAKVKARSV